MCKADDLLIGAIDMHCHVYPEFSLDVPNRFSNEDVVRIMREAGMGGVVFKSHFWPTTLTALELDKQYDDFGVHGSICLNDSAGGLSLWAVEAALRMGTRVAHMPTWSARNDFERKGVSRMMGDYLDTMSAYPREKAFYAIGADGKAIEPVKELLAFVKEKNMTLFTGHLSPEECLAVAEAAHDMGYRRLVVTHPDSALVGATPDQLAAMAELGALVEICALGISPLRYRITPQKFKEIIDRVGARQCVLTSDYFFEWLPSMPELMRMLIASLLEVGVDEASIALMVRENPQRLLAL